MASSSSSTSHWRTSSSDDRSFTQSRNSLAPEGAVVITSVARSRKVHDKKMINQYEFQESLGRGQHGEVSIAKDTVTGDIVAVKAVKRKNPKVDRMSQLRKKNLPVSPHLPLTDKLGTTEQKIRKEIAIMKKCNHPHVVKLLEVIDDGLNEKIYMVMEYLGGGEIKWRTEADEPALRVSQTRRICRDVILGLEYLHHHGIIHRDIKPANLLWSSDRRMVKIADFGVSHFSYAQQLAAAGQGEYTPEDDILMNEADLYKFAGTPMFLAPEILYDSGADTSASSSTASNLYALGSDGAGSAGATTPRKKPTITKAVDIWALGVTLYALLFGKMPFSGDGEWAIYGRIKEDDWEVEEMMGSDHIPVGGRFQSKPSPGEETEGFLVINLLDGFLQKDPNMRITLDGVKRHPWILHDMPNADQWLRQTAIEESFAVTEDETSSAVSSVKFRWPRSFAKGIYSFIRNVRPQRSFRRHLPDLDAHDQDHSGTTHNPLARQQSIAIGMFEREKAKHQQHQHHHPHSRNRSSVDIRDAPPGSRNVSGSKHLFMSVPSGTVSRIPSSDATTLSPDRPRSRLSMLTKWWKPGSATWATPSEASTSNLLSGTASPLSPTTPPATDGLRRLTHAQQPVRDLSARRSEDAFHQRGGNPAFSIAMRAASWGEVGEYSGRSDDRASIYSGDRPEEALDAETFLMGAGGVAQSPVSSVPSGVLSTVSSTLSLGPPVMSAAHVILQRLEVPDHTPGAEPTAQDPNLLHSPAQHRSHATSPLAQPASEGSSHSSSTYDQYESSSEEGSRTPSDCELQPSTSQLYQEEDDESSSEENVRLEVRTRRPSWSVNESMNSPPQRRPDVPRERSARSPIPA